MKTKAGLRAASQEDYSNPHFPEAKDIARQASALYRGAVKIESDGFDEQKITNIAHEFDALQSRVDSFFDNLKISQVIHAHIHDMSKHVRENNSPPTKEDWEMLDEMKGNAFVTLWCAEMTLKHYEGGDI